MTRRFVVAFGGMVAVASLFAVPLLSRGEPQPQPQPPVKVASRVAALRQERVNIARQALAMLDEQRLKGIAPADELAQQGEWDRRLFEAETAAAETDAARVAAAERYAESARERAANAQARFKAAVLPMSDVLRAKYDLAGAEAVLAEVSGR